MAIRNWLIATFAALFLLVQVALPVAALFGDRPGRFGWHMYSAVPDLPEVWVIRSDGSEMSVDLSRLAKGRAEINYTTALWAALCEEPDVSAVRLLRDDESELLSCS